MRLRLAAVAAIITLVVGAATACVPDPGPTPSPTVAFATEEEAFAAAEETYRAYIDALNQVDLSDPATFEEVFDWTIGEANSESRKTLSELHANGWSISGATQLRNFEGVNLSNSNVTADLCLDVSDVAIVDAAGDSVVSTTRQERQPLRVSFLSGGSATRLLISSSEALESSICD